MPFPKEGFLSEACLFVPHILSYILNVKLLYMYGCIKIPKLICSVIENKQMTLIDDNNQVSVQKRL